MNIIEAVKEARKGKKIRRKIWWKDFYIKLDLSSVAWASKFYIHSVEIQTLNDFYDEDILADDWEVVE